MTKDEIRIRANSLKQKVLDHDVVFGRAVVVLGAREVDEFADALLELLKEGDK